MEKQIGQVLKPIISRIAWVMALPPKYQSLFHYLVDWTDVPPGEARSVVEKAMANDGKEAA